MRDERSQGDSSLIAHLSSLINPLKTSQKVASQSNQVHGKTPFGASSKSVPVADQMPGSMRKPGILEATTTGTREVYTCLLASILGGFLILLT